jgi:4-amino-4-deoxy-L-arabinose transferase-like glycosyltransferase
MPASTAPAQASPRPDDAPREGARRWRRHLAGARPPAPLAALLVLTALVGVAWALVTPVFQAPDENSHFAYAQTVAETFELPGDPERPTASTEQNVAAAVSDADQAAAQLPVRMEWSQAAYDRWRARAARFPRSARIDGGGVNPAASNPPLYYLYEAAAYRVAEGGDFFTRVLVLRLASVLWLLGTVVGVWLFVGELLGRDRLLQLVAAGTAGLFPMIAFMSASINPDAMLYACFSFALWLGVVMLRRGVTPARAAALFAIVGLTCVVKATGYALLPGAVLALALGLWRARGESRRPALRAAVAAGAGLLATLGVWFVIARLMDRAVSAQVADAAGHAQTNPRQLLSYVWQFYLPRLPSMTPSLLPSDGLPAYTVWLKTGWAAFGWLEVRFASPVYVLFAAITAAVALVSLAGLWRARRTVDRAVVLFLAAVAAVLLIGLHWTEYRLLRTGAGPFNVGRYLFPLIGIGGLAVAQTLRTLRPAWRPAGAAVVLSSLLVLNVLSLALMMERFYA